MSQSLGLELNVLQALLMGTEEGILRSQAFQSTSSKRGAHRQTEKPVLHKKMILTMLAPARAKVQAQACRHPRRATACYVACRMLRAKQSGLS